MDKKELMIGNCIIDTRFPELISKVEQLHSGYAVTSNTDSLSYDKLQPVPLTPELLEKAGFVRAIDGPYELHVGYKLDFISSKDARQVNLFLDGSSSRVIVDSVHQLQNLYFSLTQAELCV